MTRGARHRTHAWFLALLLGGAALHPGSRPALAQTAEELASLRKLFAEAVAEAEKSEFDSALEKLKRVQRVKDTVRVRYWMAVCLEGQGHWREASRMYEGVIDLGAGNSKELEVVRTAKEKNAALQERMPRLTLTPSEKAPPNVSVELDGAVIENKDLRSPMPVDPGAHEVAATAPGAAPFKTQVTLTEGARLSVVLPLDPLPVAEQPPQGELPHGEPSHPPPPEEKTSRPLWGWIAVGAGAALVVGAGVTLGLRESEISTLNDACQGGVCPKSRQSELQSAHDRAALEGPLAAVLGGVGLVAIGVGVYGLLSPSAKPSKPTPTTMVLPAFSPGEGRVMLTTSF